jgi:lysophospholipase L1-like esterase
MILLRRLPWGTMTMAAVVAGLLVASLTSAASAGAAGAVGATAADPDPTYYLALGGSGSVGVQPTPADPSGEPTDSGYADDLVRTERSHWPDLQLVKLGCPGATTTTLMHGGDRCHYQSGSQLSDALTFIRSHASTVLVTVDIGFNNVRPCLAHRQVDTACAASALSLVHDQLAAILAALRSAGGSGMTIVGVGHYDPFLGRYFSGPLGRTFAMGSSGVISQLNEVLRTTYGEAGIAMANVAASFDSSDTHETSVAGEGHVPVDVTRVCELTWMCDPPPLGPNQHPNDAGYRAISEAISALIPGH